MYARATTTITIWRGQTEDEWGDPKDLPNPVATGVRASITVQKSYNKSEITTQPRNIRYARMRVTKGTDVQTNDRIKDERTGEIWTILGIEPMQNPVVGQDLRIDLQIVG